MLLYYEKLSDNEANFQVNNILIHESVEDSDKIVDGLKNVSGFIIKTANWVSPIFRFEDQES